MKPPIHSQRRGIDRFHAVPLPDTETGVPGSRGDPQGRQSLRPQLKTRGVQPHRRRQIQKELLAAKSSANRSGHRTEDRALTSRLNSHGDVSDIRRETARAQLEVTGLSVAAAPMMPDLGFTQLQIGWLEQGFAVGYAVFQIPIGIFAERWGARGTLVLMGLAAVIAMLATPLAPSLFTGTTLFACLLSLQVLLGVSQAATFPVSAGVFQQWFPSNRWALVVGLQTMGLQLGAAATPPLIAFIL